MNLKEIRQAKGMTQKELAEKSGVIRQAISNIECGFNKPSVKTAKAIARVLDFDWTEFFSEDEVIKNDEGEEE